MAPIVVGSRSVREMPCVGTKFPQRGQSLSIATTIVGTAGSSIDTSAVATPSACSTLSVGAVAVIAVGCTTVAAVFVATPVESDSEDLAAGHQERR